MNRRVALFIGWIFALGATAAYTQSMPTSLSAPAGAFGTDPEDAYLSPSRYTNAYFGFAFDFPEVGVIEGCAHAGLNGPSHSVA